MVASKPSVDLGPAGGIGIGDREMIPGIRGKEEFVEPNTQFLLTKLHAFPHLSHLGLLRVIFAVEILAPAPRSPRSRQNVAALTPFEFRFPIMKRSSVSGVERSALSIRPEIAAPARSSP
jgi:hypothetical protein